MKKIEMKGTWNVRDLGGTVMKDGRTLRYGRLIRSAYLYTATDEDLKVLSEIPVVKVFDFRGEQELNTVPDHIIPGAEYFHCQLLNGPRPSDKKRQTNAMESQSEAAKEEKRGLSRHDFTAKEFYDMYHIAYTTIVENPLSLAALKKFIEGVADTDNGAVLFHCYGGKDRTGVAAMLLLEILGADRETIMEDYLYTNEHLGPVGDRARQRENDPMPRPAWPEDVWEVQGAMTDYLETTYRSILSRYPDVKTFLLEGVGVSEETLERIRENCLE